MCCEQLKRVPVRGMSSMSEIAPNSEPAHLLTPESFSEMVLIQAEKRGESILETMTSVCEEYDIDEVRVKKMITAPLLSRLTAECADARLLKGSIKSKKIF
ncbi:hypothetical protein DEEACLCL_00138 [Salmonella phage CRW-SP2]|nr:hypothetical protein DEEACLCL_00138 [Salmonella phage CRW-SP2]